jgi:DNA-binding MarR family transcriptional regulator
MNIEKEIHQKEFASEHNKAIVNLVYTYNWVIEQLKTIFKREKITMQQFNILRILRGSKVALSTMQIRDRMLDKMSDTSRIVDRLLTKGLVTKKTCSADNRLVDILITKKGLNVLSKLDIYQKELEQIVGALSIKEAHQLNALLDKIRSKQA